ncbi:MAG TPA: fluoride efflux transporter CrcB [Anaerolineae bacterium]|nr:fluoride efflux transporter CrcB [Anaerolineae bacterium]
MKYLVLGLGGFIGVNLRYLVQTWAAGRWGPDFPYGTLLINVVGSFILALFVTLATTRLIVSPNLRLFVAVGLLGGFTTFSSFTVETLNLLQGGRWLPSALYLLGNVLLGLLAAMAGIVLARAL